MKFWQSMFLCEGDQLFDAAQIAEEVGFDGAAVSDHLVHFEHVETPYPYSADGKPPSFTGETVWPEAWSTCSALAAKTTRLQFVTNVYIVPLRHPVELAKATSSAAYFSGGRICLGAGAGWMKEEFDMLGVDFHTRGKRFDECIDVMRKLWSGNMVEHHGEFFDFAPMQMTPSPAQPVPIYIGGMSKAALRRAAQLGDGWMGPGQTVDAALETVTELNRLRAECGRSNEPFHFFVPLYGGQPNDVDDIKRLVDAGVDGIVSLPFAFNIGPNSTVDQKRAYLEDYASKVIAKVRG
ncbi:MAG: LLM class F420-dependent oxidoreductase [Rubrivivax sp.]|nr:LLM class F420-dependent oxidoreductase [Rubrivivax sp.]